MTTAAPNSRVNIGISNMFGISAASSLVGAVVTNMLQSSSFVNNLIYSALSGWCFILLFAFIPVFIIFFRWTSYGIFTPLDTLFDKILLGVQVFSVSLLTSWIFFYWFKTSAVPLFLSLSALYGVFYIYIRIQPSPDWYKNSESLWLPGSVTSIIVFLIMNHYDYHFVFASVCAGLVLCFVAISTLIIDSYPSKISRYPLTSSAALNSFLLVFWGASVGVMPGGNTSH